MTSGQTALAVSSALFLACLLFAAWAYVRRRSEAGGSPSPPPPSFIEPAPAPTSAPTVSPATSSRHPVLAAADWIAAETNRRAADRLIDEAVDAGVPDELDRLRALLAPKGGSAPDPSPK